MNLGPFPAEAIVLGVYVFGVVVGLLAIDARWPARVGLALLWPLGPIAFVITISMLLLASLIAFPTFGMIVVAAVLGTAAIIWLAG